MIPSTEHTPKKVHLIYNDDFRLCYSFSDERILSARCKCGVLHGWNIKSKAIVSIMCASS